MTAGDDGLELAKAFLARAKAGVRRAGGRRSPAGRRGGDSAAGPGGRTTSGPGWSGANSDDRDPQPLRDAVDRLVDEHGWEPELAVHGVVARWDAIVGSEVAAHATPEGYADGVLTVRAATTAWATQLRLLAPTLVRRLNEEIGDGMVTWVNVLGPHVPGWRKGPRSVRGRGPRDTYG